MRTRTIAMVMTAVAAALLAGCGDGMRGTGDAATADEGSAAPSGTGDVDPSEPETSTADSALLGGEATDAADAALVRGGPDVNGRVAAGEYAHHQTLAGVEIHWANDAELLWMALVAPVAGYLAVGFDPVDRKVGANYIIGYVEDGEAVIRDHVGTRGNLQAHDPIVGGTDDILQSAGTETDGVTTLEFVIPLDTGDASDRPLSPGETYELQVAYQSNRDDLVSWHSRHGVGEIALDPVP